MLHVFLIFTCQVVIGQDTNFQSPLLMSLMHLHRETDPKDRSPFQEQMKHTQAEIYCDRAATASVSKLRNISRPYSYSRDDSATKCDLFLFGSLTNNCFFDDRTLQRNRVQMTLTVCVNACPGNYKHALVISVGLRFNRPTRGINFLPSITSTSGSEQLLRESLLFGTTQWKDISMIHLFLYLHNSTGYSHNTDFFILLSTKL